MKIYQEIINYQAIDRVYKGGLYLYLNDEEEELLYEGYDIETEPDEEYVVCKIGDYFKVRAWHVRNFFKYLLKNFEDLEEDEDSDEE